MSRTAILQWVRFWNCAALGACVVLPVNMAAAAVIHDFGSGGDGSMPTAPVIMDAAGHLYGTTQAGGAFGYGTVYEMTREIGFGWQYSIIYSFHGNADGAEPFGRLSLDSAGALYGTTFDYNPQTAGTVFKLAPPAAGETAWTKTTLATFPGDALPSSGPLLASSGMIYGALSGSSSNLGSIYQISPPAAGSGGQYSLDVIYQFTDKSAGFDPVGELILNGKGYLTGVTEYGGSQACGANGCGTVFQLRPPANGHAGWSLKRVYRFRSSAESNPLAGVVADAYGGLYGTATGPAGTVGGIVYKLTPEGDGMFSFSRLYSFSRSSQPSRPTQLVLDRLGNLFGISYYGGTGCGSEGCGTLFGLSPPADGATVWTETLLISAELSSGAYPEGLALGTDHHLYETLFLKGPFKGGALFRQDKGAD